MGLSLTQVPRIAGSPLQGFYPDFEDKRKASLGLQLVGDLSQQLGGSLVIDSAAGPGARFSVVFAVQVPAPLVMPT